MNEQKKFTVPFETKQGTAKNGKNYTDEVEAILASIPFSKVTVAVDGSTFKKEGKPSIIHIGYVEGYDVEEKTLSVVINNKKFIESGQTIKSLNVRVIETDNGVKITSIQCYLKAERTNTVINR